MKEENYHEGSLQFCNAIAGKAMQVESTGHHVQSLLRLGDHQKEFEVTRNFVIPNLAGRC